MSFVVLEDLRKPLPRRRFHPILTFRIVRPLYRLARVTYRGSRFLLRKAIWVIRGDAKKTAASETVMQEVRKQNE